MESPVTQVLLLEDSPERAGMFSVFLLGNHGAEFELEARATLADALSRLAQGGVDVVLVDLTAESDRALAQLEKKFPRVPAIIVNESEAESEAVRAMQSGAEDYLVRSHINRPLLVRSIRYAIERKRAETALILAEENYRGIFEHIVEGVFQTSPDGRFLSANPALARIYGYDSSEDLMKGLTDIGRSLYVEPGRRDEFIHLMQENDVVKDFQSQIYRKDGGIIWISENVRAIRNAAGRLICYEGTVEDITERKKTEEQLRNSEALYHSLVENLPQNIFRKDLNERFIFANQRFCLTLGRPLEEILGKTDFDFFPSDLAAKYQADDRKITEGGGLFEAVEEHQPPGGRKLYVQVVKTPVYDARGQIIGLQGIFWDITERKEAEERERKANIELARSREELHVKNQQMEQDLVMAREIQQAMLPQQYPAFPRGSEPADSALRFVHRYHPSGTVGGDFFNVLSLSETKAGVFICDVMGHGVKSALVTAMIRALVEELREAAQDPGQLLTLINRDLRAILKQTGTPTFATGFYLVMDLETGIMAYANAGHPKPFYIQRNSGSVELLANANNRSAPALGLFDNSAYTATSLRLSPGDLLFLFTDGLFEVEGHDDALYTQEMLVEAVTRRAQMQPGEMFDALLAEIRAFSTNGQFMDDVCMVGMEVVRLLGPARS